MGIFGSLTMQADGSWIYAFGGGEDPSNAAAYGPSPHDTFSYTISDGHGGFDTATLDIAVISTGPIIGVPQDDSPI